MSASLEGFFANHQVILAPMAGVTDIAMRQLCLEQGAQVTYTEMVSAKALSFANEKTRHLLQLAEGESQVAVQLFGHEPDVMAREAAWVEEAMGESLLYLDINMGCPARKIAGKGDGSALMRDPELAAQIVSSVCAAVEHPVTVKFRRGYFNDQETAPEFARRMEQAGAAAVAVHGRFAMQIYHGKADWGAIARVREAVSIPVIGNGDVVSAQDALGLRECTGVDAVMIGRGAQGNPWVFAQVRAALEGRPVPSRPTVTDRVDMAKRHATILERREGRNVVRMRKHCAWYLTGVPGAAAARGRINDCKTVEDFHQVLDDVAAYAAEFYRQHGLPE